MSPAGRSGVAEPPLVTVVIPTHNRRDLVLEAVASVLAQTWTNFELIVVDDGSTDGTAEALRAFADPRLRIISCAHSGNVALLRNRGVAAGTGEWVAFLDSDDLWEPDKLERQVGALKASGTMWSYTGFNLIDADGNPIPMRAGVFRAICGNVLEALLRDETGACICTVVVAREVFDAVGGFDENLLSMEDLDFELRLAANAEAVALPDVLVRVRDHPGRKTNSEAFPHEQSAKVFERVLRERPAEAISQIARERCAAHLAAAAIRRLAVGDLLRSLPLLARSLMLRASRPRSGGELIHGLLKLARSYRGKDPIERSLGDPDNEPVASRTTAEELILHVGRDGTAFQSAISSPQCRRRALPVPSATNGSISQIPTVGKPSRSTTSTPSSLMRIPRIELPGLRGADKLLYDYRRFAGRRFPLAMTLMIGGALAEGIGILTLVPLLTLIDGSAEIPRSVRNLIGEPAISAGERWVLALGLFFSAMGARSLILYRRDRLLSELCAAYDASLKQRCAESLAARGWAAAAKIGQAGMQSLLMTDAPRAAVAVHYFQAGLVALVMLVVQLALAVVLSVELSLVGILLIATGMSLSWLWIGRGQRSGIAISEHSRRCSDASFRFHVGLKAALAQGTVADFLTEYARNLQNLTRETVLFHQDRALASGLGSAGAAVLGAMLLLIGDRVIDLSFAVLLTILVLFARMSAPAHELQQSLQSFAAYVPSYLAVYGHMQAAPPLPNQKRLVPLSWHRLSINDVTYRHGECGGVEGLSLELKAGEWLGIAGRSGAGKTTLADLVAGLLPPQHGCIRVDGETLEDETLERWRAGLAYIGQAHGLFHDTIRSNLEAEGRDTDDDELWAMLDTVGLAPRISAFPARLDAKLQDSASNLSGGERQRLVIASALLRRPRLLILDEATNAIDTVSEIELLKRLRALELDSAAVLVAHRPASLAICDRVVHLIGGAERHATTHPASAAPPPHGNIVDCAPNGGR